MAPEQGIGYAGPSGDIYSLAKLVIEILAGRRLAYLLPNATLDLPDRVPELLESLGIKLSQNAIDMLCRALDYHPANRPHAAGSFADPLVRDLESDVTPGEG
jgi:serine/threonine protein kinase